MNDQMKNESNKEFLTAISGQKTKHVPFWFMRQAGRYLPEYRELRAQKGGFLAMALDPVSACEITIQPLRRFDMDAAIIFSDILTIPMGLGMNLEFVKGEGPKLSALSNAEDLLTLDKSHMEKLQSVYDALSLTRETMDIEGFTDTALIGFAGSPWTVATYMVEGGGSKDYLKTRRWSFEDPDGFQALIDIITTATIDYLSAQIKAGAEAIQLFDSWAGILDYQSFKRWSIKPTTQIVSALKREFPDTPIIGFPKGGGTNVIEYAKETGITALGLGSQVSVETAKSYQKQLPVQGNLDPLLLLAGGDIMEKTAREILENLSGGPFVFNLGHGIHKETPVEHVELLVKIIREY